MYLNNNIPKYNKNIYKLDIGQVSYAIINNIRFEQFRNRYNIMNPNTVINKFRPIEYSVYRNYINSHYGFSYTLISKPNFLALKYIISWRLKRYWYPKHNKSYDPLTGKLINKEV